VIGGYGSQSGVIRRSIFDIVDQIGKCRALVSGKRSTVLQEYAKYISLFCCSGRKSKATTPEPIAKACLLTPFRQAASPLDMGSIAQFRCRTNFCI
jgi:hypothetical protein